MFKIEYYYYANYVNSDSDKICYSQWLGYSRVTLMKKASCRLNGLKPFKQTLFCKYSINIK